MTRDPDVLVVGAGGDGPALAWKLGDLGLDVLVLEAGPWYGNEKWPEPNRDRGATASSDPSDLSGELLDRQLRGLENETNDTRTGKLRYGPADRSRGSWSFEAPSVNVNQLTGVGGTTQHYYANHPRATVPSVNDSDDWPIAYGDIVPYYRTIEDTFPFGPGPTTTKEKVFYAAAEGAGFEFFDGLNVTADDLPNYRPTPNLYAEPDPKLKDEDYDGSFEYPEVEGDVLANDAYRGGASPKGAPVSEKARQSSNVSWVPEALETGNVTIRPNTFVTNVKTKTGWFGDPTATGVEYRDTWTGETGSIKADVVVLAAGTLQTPRIWLNSGLPDNGWVGKGLTNHWFDAVHGVFDPDTLEAIVGKRTLEPNKGQPWVARIEREEGIIGIVGGNAPGAHAALMGTSAAGLASDNDASDALWDTHGQLVGQELKDMMSAYQRTMTLLVSIDDVPRQRNGVSLSEDARDEHGPTPRIDWQPGETDVVRRETLAQTAAQVLKGAGAEWIHRSDMVPFLIHVHGTMAMGKVIDEGGEAYDVDRLFVGDHGAIPNALGGQNPTHTGQALALRTAEHIYERHFSRW